MIGHKLKELARLVLLGVVAAWLLHPFATTRMYGAGDAVWYEHMLADYVIQLRAGVFPIFAGQTNFAFNGAVYPLRVAPMYQHLAGILDLITGRSLGFVALQHLEVVVCGLAGIYGCYCVLCAISPDKRWSAAGLSILYLSCPGILATIYTQDLYMTWMTVPLAPLAVYGIVRTFKKDDVTSQIWLAAPLAALWWAHSPIALWFTFIAFCSQVARVTLAPKKVGALKRLLLSAAVFGILAQYPFVSVAALKTPGVASTVVGPLGQPEKLMEFIRSAFPSSVLPLSENAAALSDLQLGYGLWAVLTITVIVVAGSPRPELILLLACVALLLILVFPIAPLTPFLWGHFPATVVRITYYWPMQRFYLIIAALLVGAGQLAFRILEGVRSSAIVALLLLSCGWSLWESRQFIRSARERTASLETTERSQRPENIALMDHAYGLFQKLPIYFSNGAMDPLSETRLLEPDSHALLTLSPGDVVAAGSLVSYIDANPGIRDFSPTLHLAPGRRYNLEFKFGGTEPIGILQFSGRTLFREYSLPSSGEARAFGATEANIHSVDLWSTAERGDDVSVRFIPLEHYALPVDSIHLWSFCLRYRGDEVRITDLIPFEAYVRSPKRALLESPRVFEPGYRANVGGRSVEVRRSPEGFVSVFVPAGTSTVRIWFVGPPLLRLSYWFALVGWATLLAAIPFALMRPSNSFALAR